MTRIIAVGYTAGELLPGQPVVHNVRDTVTQADLGQLVDVMAGDDQAVVIAIAPAWRHDLSFRRLQTVRAAVDPTRVLLYRSALPPLAGSVLCVLAAAVAPFVGSPGLIMAGLPLLERQLLPVAYLRSVARLRHPAPSVWQRLASGWPPSSFGVSWWPRPGVHRLPRHDTSIPLPHPSEWRNVRLDRMLAAGSDSSGTAWVRLSVAAPLLVSDVAETDPTPLAATYWGTSSAVEAVAYPSNVGAMGIGVSRHQHASNCRWCGALVAAASCPFCGMDCGPVSRQEAAE